MTDGKSSDDKVLASCIMSGLLATAAAVWHSAYWWWAVAACAIGAAVTGWRRSQSTVANEPNDVDTFLQAAQRFGRAEMAAHASLLPRLVSAVFREDRTLPAGAASIDKPGIWENTQICCAACGTPYDERLKYDLHLRPAAASQMLRCPSCEGEQVVLTYVRPQ